MTSLESETLEKIRTLTIDNSKIIMRHQEIIESITKVVNDLCNNSNIHRDGIIDTLNLIAKIGKK